MKMGPGLDPDTQLGPLVSAEQHDRVTGYIEKGKAEGAELVAGGGGRGPGYFIEPTLFTTDVRRPRDHARGDLRPGAGRVAVRLDRGGRRARERLRVRARRRSLDPRRRHRAPPGGAAAGRHRVRERLGPHRPGGAVRRLQGLRRGPRARPRGARGVPRDEDGLDQPELAARRGSRCARREPAAPLQRRTAATVALPPIARAPWAMSSRIARTSSTAPFGSGRSQSM